MRIEYELTAEDWADFGEYCAGTAPEFRRAARNGLAGGILLSLAGSVVLWQKSGVIWWLAAGICAALVWSIYWPRHLVSHARAHMTQRQRPCIGSRHIIEATPGGLHSKCDISDSTIQWAGIHTIAETSGHVFVMLSEVGGYVVPRARVLSGDLDQFVRQARELGLRRLAR